MTEIFCLNKREYPSLQTLCLRCYHGRSRCNHGGEYGTNLFGDFVNKGDEKGYFKLGSTVCRLFEKIKLVSMTDLLINTLKGYETSVKQGLASMITPHKCLVPK
jgi:phosphatidylserine decarboxylase